MQDRLLEAHLKARRTLPGALMQLLLKIYLSAYFRVEPLTGRMGSVAVEASDEFASDSDRLMVLHYNIPLPLFAHCLGPSMKYSMALWDEDTPNLEAAQEAMMRDLCLKAGITEGQSVLDIGCGFGSFA